MNFLLSILIILIIISIIKYIFFTNNSYNNSLICDDDDDEDEDEDINLYDIDTSKKPISNSTLFDNTNNCVSNKKAKDYLNNFIHENFKINIEYPPSPQLSFKPIKSNKLYYGLPCKYIKNDCFYKALKEENFKVTDDITKACLIVPCSYESTEKEINDLRTKGIKNNLYGDAIRIFMLNNTDHMVSKLALWKYLKTRFGDEASTMIPYSWDLTTTEGINKFKNDFDKNKMYITKNNKQRQEGLKMFNNLDDIINSKNEYILVQEVLQNPYLVNGRKINLRVYVLIIRDNYGNIKLQIYKDGFMYYTKKLFKKNELSFDYNVTTGYVDREVYAQNPLTHYDFRKFLDKKGRELNKTEQYIKKNYPKIKFSDHIFSQIYKLLVNIFQTYENTVGTKTDGVSFQLYGTDIAIDEDLNPMIMEINKGPDLSGKDIRDTDLKVGLGKDILKSLGLIQNKDNKFVTSLEMINKNGHYTTIYNLTEVK
jgi:hypothetical protein